MQSALVAGLHTNQSFKSFKKRTKSTDSIYLSEEELERIYKKELSGHLDKARDYFIIGAYTGLRFEDWDTVSGDKVADGILRVKSSKTNEVSSYQFIQTLLPYWQSMGVLCLLKPTNQKMNDNIKVVAM